MESELLARISGEQREFLTRAAVLDRMCGPLCEAALDLPGSSATLADLAGSNLLLVPLDNHREWYRYHHLFRDMLHAELERREPALVPVLRRRAAAWYERNGLPEEAVEYSIAAGDADTAARLTEQIWMQFYFTKRATAERWLDWLEKRNAVKGRPVIAAIASLLYQRWGGPRSPNGGPTRSTDGNTRTRTGPVTPPAKGMPRWSDACTAAAGSSRCAPTPRSMRGAWPPRAA